MFRGRSSLSLWGVLRTELFTWAKLFPEQVDPLSEKAWEDHRILTPAKNTEFYLFLEA